MKSCYYISGDLRAVGIADLCDYYSQGMIITRLNVLPEFRSLGLGTNILKQILMDADKEGITLWLEVSPSGDMNSEQLVAWYKKHGFVEHKGCMRRKPK